MEVITDEDLDFKSQFYNLQGIHINERKKNFYKLLNSTSLKIAEDQIDIQPRSYQETIFYVDVLIHFKKVDKLIKILKEGHGVVSSKILKQRWFFQEAFKNMSEEDIVNNFLPSLSYSMRMKVLKKLSLAFSEEKMDNIFDLVLERYGLFIAKQFLFSCSPEKIVYVLENSEIILLPEQLKRILQKDINLLKVYFEQYKKNKRHEFDDQKFLSYLVWKHPNLYFELGRNIKLGYYTTRAVIKNNREGVLNDIQNSCWNKGALVREFGKEYFYQCFASQSMDSLDGWSCRQYLIKYPIKKRWEVLSQAFKQVYKKDIVDHLDKLSEALVGFFPEEAKQKWADIKYLETADLGFIKYTEAKKTFKLLKEKINVTADIEQRGTFLNALTTVCCFNKDYATYEEVLKYICIRHRNDDNNIREKMISHIGGYVDYDQLTEDHWMHINEIIDIQRIRGERLPFEIMAEYLLFLYKKEQPLDGSVRQYIEDCIKVGRSLRLLPWWKEAERTILTHIVKVLPTIQVEDKRKLTYDIMSNIIDFNRDVRTDKLLNKNFDRLWIDLNECPPIMDLINEVFTKKERDNYIDYKVLTGVMYYNGLYSKNPLKVIDEETFFNILYSDDQDTFQDLILHIIKKPRRNSFENNLLDYFFRHIKEKYSNYLKYDAIKYFFAKEPEVIAKYFSLILEFDVNSGDTALDYGLIKKYSHMAWDKRLIIHFKNFVSVDSKCEEKVKLLNALATVMNTENFLDLVKDYTPIEKKLDLNNQEQREIYRLQCDIAKKAFRNLDEPAILAPVLMEFSQGDYLQSSLPALYKVLYQINEEKASSYLGILGERAVSTRKHAIFLGFELLPLKNSLALYFALCEKEKNVSTKKYLFDAGLKFFLKNPLESLLDKVFLNMNFVDKNDIETIRRLVESVNKVTDKYRPVFVEKVWKYLETLEQQEVKVTHYRNTLLNIINEHGVRFVLRLNKNFSEHVVKDFFLPSGNYPSIDSCAINLFVINYLLVYLDDQHFEFVFNILRSYKNIYWESKDVYKRRYIFNFFDDLYAKIYENDVKFLNLFKSFWQLHFNHEECFCQYILLRLIVLYKENNNIESFSKEVDKVFQGLIGKYGPYINKYLITAIQTFYRNIPTQNNTDFNLGNFAFYLLKSNSSKFNCFAAFSIINENFTREDQKEKVVDTLKVIDDGAVRIYCNLLLRS